MCQGEENKRTRRAWVRRRHAHAPHFFVTMLPSFPYRKHLGIEIFFLSFQRPANSTHFHSLTRLQMPTAGRTTNRSPFPRRPLKNGRVGSAKTGGRAVLQSSSPTLPSFRAVKLYISNHLFLFISIWYEGPNRHTFEGHVTKRASSRPTLPPARELARDACHQFSLTSRLDDARCWRRRTSVDGSHGMDDYWNWQWQDEHGR